MNILAQCSLVLAVNYLSYLNVVSLFERFIAKLIHCTRTLEPSFFVLFIV
jgi:hypothetical protein